MVSLVNSHANTASKRWHLWEIGLRFALNSTPEWRADLPEVDASDCVLELYRKHAASDTPARGSNMMICTTNKNGARERKLRCPPTRCLVQLTKLGAFCAP